MTPRTMAVAGGALLAFSVLYFGATAYLVMRDDGPPPETGQQEQLLENYEDRISALRTEIAQLHARREADHATVTEKVDRLLDMQQSLDERQKMLARLTDAARKAGFDIPPPKPVARPTKGERQASAVPVANPVAVYASAATTGADGAPQAPVLDHVEDRIVAMEAEQQRVVSALGSRVASRADRIATVLSRLGIKLPKSLRSDVGGPFVPLQATDISTSDERLDADAQALAANLDRLRKARALVRRLPLSRPTESTEITSGFGPRRDPFLGRPAMHTGVDFRDLRGAPARAVAAGTVIAAGWEGGYGNMVDVDLGNGMVTRFGHLSAIDVKVGDRVRIGDTVGHVGSTGRSTGPHLHYEIRIDGRPVNPMRFLQAGDEIAALL